MSETRSSTAPADEPAPPAPADARRARKRPSLARLLAFGLVIGALVLAYSLGWLDAVLDRERFIANVRSAGSWSYAVYLVTFVLVQPLGIPSAVFLVAASVLWPTALAFTMALIGGTCSSLVGFWFARYLARDWVASRLPDRVRRYEQTIAERGFYAVLLVRFIFLYAPVVHWLLGVSPVRFSSYVLGTVLGALPGITVWLVVGKTGLSFL